MTLQIVSLDDLPAFSLTESVTARALFGEQIMLNVLDFEPGGIIVRHHHPHEQLGLVLAGELLIVTEAGERWMRAGDAYALPPDAPHEGRAGDEGCRVLDLFHPIREDYRELSDRAAGGGR